ncbi:hypothetical protein BgiBS90_030963 [Biomphalaria glabrata]|nr:hypothetical protein BgiBS90_030963 [Biomphalaria glabrata]
MLDKTKTVENVKNDKCGDVWFHELGRAYRVGIHCSTAAYWPRHARRRHLTSRRLRNSFFSPVVLQPRAYWGKITASTFVAESSLHMSRRYRYTCPWRHRYNRRGVNATPVHGVIATPVPRLPLQLPGAIATSVPRL